MLSFSIPLPLTLACACVFSYLIGRIKIAKTSSNSNDPKPTKKIAQSNAVDLDPVVEKLSEDLANQRAAIAEFNKYVEEVRNTGSTKRNSEITRAAESTLHCVMRLATQLSCEIDELRRKANQLKVPSNQVPIDQLTGLQDLEVLEKSLARMFSMQSRYELPFSIVSINVRAKDDLSGQKQKLDMEAMLSRTADGICTMVRASDVLARDDNDGLVILLPNTRTDTATHFVKRVQEKVSQFLPLYVSAGIATALPADDPQSLLRRAADALSIARDRGDDQIGCHDGQQCRCVADTKVEKESVVATIS